MHIRFTVGGKYTNAVIDLPVPVVDWWWQRIHDKYFAQQKEETEEMRRLRNARMVFEEAARLQSKISQDLAAKSAEFNGIDDAMEVLKRMNNGRRR